VRFVDLGVFCPISLLLESFAFVFSPLFRSFPFFWSFFLSRFTRLTHQLYVGQDSRHVAIGAVQLYRFFFLTIKSLLLAFSFSFGLSFSALLRGTLFLRTTAPRRPTDLSFRVSTGGFSTPVHKISWFSGSRLSLRLLLCFFFEVCAGSMWAALQVRKCF